MKSNSKALTSMLGFTFQPYLLVEDSLVFGAVQTVLISITIKYMARVIRIVIKR